MRSARSICVHYCGTYARGGEQAVRFWRMETGDAWHEQHSRRGGGGCWQASPGGIPIFYSLLSPARQMLEKEDCSILVWRAARLAFPPSPKLSSAFQCCWFGVGRRCGRRFMPLSATLSHGGLLPPPTFFHHISLTSLAPCCAILTLPYMA